MFSKKQISVIDNKRATAKNLISILEKSKI